MLSTGNQKSANALISANTNAEIMKKKLRDALKCEFIDPDRYNEVDFLSVSKMLLDVYSVCVKAQIDLQNTIVSETYLQEYQTKGTSANPIVFRGICDSSTNLSIDQKKTLYELENQIRNATDITAKIKLINQYLATDGISMYDNVIYTLLKKDVTNMSAGVADKTYKFDHKLSSKYASKLMDIVIHIQQETQDFTNFKNVIFYIDMLHDELVSIIKASLNAVKSLMGVFPLIEKQLVNILHKSNLLTTQIDTDASKGTKLKLMTMLNLNEIINFIDETFVATVMSSNGNEVRIESVSSEEIDKWISEKKELALTLNNNNTNFPSNKNTTEIIIYFQDLVNTLENPVDHDIYFPKQDIFYDKYFTNLIKARDFSNKFLKDNTHRQQTYKGRNLLNIFHFYMVLYNDKTILNILDNYDEKKTQTDFMTKMLEHLQTIVNELTSLVVAAKVMLTKIPEALMFNPNSSYLQAIESLNDVELLKVAQHNQDLSDIRQTSTPETARKFISSLITPLLPFWSDLSTMKDSDFSIQNLGQYLQNTLKKFPKEKQKLYKDKSDEAMSFLIFIYSIYNELQENGNNNSSKGGMYSLFSRLIIMPRMTFDIIKTSCPQSDQPKFETCVRNKLRDILTNLFESSFVILRKFIVDNFKADDQFYFLIAIIDDIPQAEKNKYAVAVADILVNFSPSGIKDFFEKKTNANVNEIDEFQTTGFLLTLKKKLKQLINFMKKFNSDIKKQSDYISFFVDLTFVVLTRISNDKGIFLLQNQFMYAYMANLSDPKSDIYQAIVLSDMPKLFFAVVKIAINSFPTLLLKYFQILDSIMKDSPYAELWMKIVGKKLDYPVMGDNEVRAIANLVLQNATVDSIQKVGKLLFPASVGQVHLFKSRALLSLSKNEDFEVAFKKEATLTNPNSDAFKISKYMYLKAKKKAFKALLKEEEKELTSQLDTFNYKILDVINTKIFLKLNWNTLIDNKEFENIEDSIVDLLIFSVAEDSLNNLFDNNKSIARLLDAICSLYPDPESTIPLLDYFGITKDFITPTDMPLITATSLGNILETFVEDITKKVFLFMKKSENPIQRKKIHNGVFNMLNIFNSKFLFMSIDKTLQSDYTPKIEKKIKEKYNRSNRSYYVPIKDRIIYLKDQIETIVKNFDLVVKLGVESYHKFTLESILPILDTILTNIQKQTIQYQEFKESLQEDMETNDKALALLADTYTNHKAHIDKTQPNVDAIVTRSSLQKHIIKFVKIRSRMGLCIEKSVIPESVKLVVDNYKTQKLDEKLMKSLSSFVGLLTCKIKDVSDEFDLWEELINTNEAKEMYDYPSSFDGDADYDQLDNFRIRVADIMKTFEATTTSVSSNSDGIKPLYVVNTAGEEDATVDINGKTVAGHNFVLFTDDASKPIKGTRTKKPVQRGFYTAMIQDQMPGKPVGRLDKSTMPAAELACMKKAVLKFMAIYFTTIFTSGKFHGDPHPGNLMWDYKTESGTDIGQLSVIDFGDWVEIAEDRRMALFSVAIFVLITFFNPLPTVYTDNYVCGKLANIIVKLMRLDTYDLEKLALFCVRNNLSKTPISKENLIKNMRTNTEYLAHVRTMCTTAFELRIAKRLAAFAKKITKNIDGGTVGDAFGMLKDPDVFDNIFAEINNVSLDPNDPDAVNCERFGQGIYKLVEAIMKLYEFKNYLSFDKGELVDLAFNMIVTITNNKNILISDADRISYLEMIASLKIAALLALNINRPEYKNNEQYVTKMINLYITAAAATIGSYTASFVGASLFPSNLAESIQNNTNKIDKLSLTVTNLNQGVFDTIAATVGRQGKNKNSTNNSTSTSLASSTANALTSHSGKASSIVGWLTASSVWGSIVGGTMNLGGTILNTCAAVAAFPYLTAAGISTAAVTLAALYYTTYAMRKTETEIRVTKTAALKKYVLLENGNTIEIFLQSVIGLAFESVQIILQQVLKQNINPNIIQNYLTDLQKVGTSIGTIAQSLGGHNLQNSIFAPLLSNYVKYSAYTNLKALQFLKKITQTAVASLSFGYKSYVAFVLNEDTFEKAGLMQFLDKDKIKNLYTALPANDNALLFYRYHSSMQHVIDKTITKKIVRQTLVINHENLLTFAKDVEMILNSPQAQKAVIEAIFNDLYSESGLVSIINGHNVALTNFLQTIKQNTASLAGMEASLQAIVTALTSKKGTKEDATKFNKELFKYKDTLDIINTAKDNFIDYVTKSISTNKKQRTGNNFGITIDIEYDARPYKGSIHEIIAYLQTTISSNTELLEASYNMSMKQFVIFANMYGNINTQEKLSLNHNAIVTELSSSDNYITLEFKTVDTFVDSNTTFAQLSASEKKIVKQICKKYLLQYKYFCNIKELRSTLIAEEIAGLNQTLKLDTINTALDNLIESIKSIRENDQSADETLQNAMERKNNFHNATQHVDTQASNDDDSDNVSSFLGGGKNVCHNFINCAIYDILFM